MNISLITDKIQGFKKIQNVLKSKLIENEQFKNKLIKIKNEEIDYIKKEIAQKTKSVTSLEKSNEKKDEIIEHNEHAIKELHDQLKGYSNELQTLKIAKENNFSSSNPKGKLSGTNNEKFTSNKKLHSLNDSGFINQSNIGTGVNSSTTSFIKTIKDIIKQIEDKHTKKSKIKKKFKLLLKEKSDILENLRKNEEKLKNKLENTEQTKERVEHLLKTDDDNK